jgi:hypothetical protein
MVLPLVLGAASLASAVLPSIIDAIAGSKTEAEARRAIYPRHQAMVARNLGRGMSPQEAEDSASNELLPALQEAMNGTVLPPWVHAAGTLGSIALGAGSVAGIAKGGVKGAISGGRALTNWVKGKAAAKGKDALAKEASTLQSKLAPSTPRLTYNEPAGSAVPIVPREREAFIDELNQKARSTPRHPSPFYREPTKKIGYNEEADVKRQMSMHGEFPEPPTATPFSDADELISWAEKSGHSLSAQDIAALRSKFYGRGGG